MQQELTKAASGIIEALKSSPVTLALVLMNFALLGYLYYVGVTTNAERKHETELLYKNRRETAILLARCNWPAGEPLPKGFDFDTK